MSMIRCHLCERVVDTDFDTEGLWPAVSKQNASEPYGTLPDYVCWDCAQEQDEKTLHRWGYTIDGDEL